MDFYWLNTRAHVIAHTENHKIVLIKCDICDDTEAVTKKRWIKIHLLLSVKLIYLGDAFPSLSIF